MDPKRLTQKIKEQARSLGFDAIGVAPIEAIPGELLQIWLARQFHGEMSYMERTAEKRADPAKVLPGVRSIISLALNYFHPYELPYEEPECGAISRYASGDDYHDVLNEKLKELENALRAAETEKAKQEIKRQLKSLRDEQRRNLEDLDELNQRMERPENRADMKQQREQLPITLKMC